MIDKSALQRRILALIAENGQDVAKRLAGEFDLSRQAANVHLKELENQKLIEASGNTRARIYSLATTHSAQKTYACQGLEEDRVWRELFAPVVADLPENVRDIWRYGVTEMVNNAIDHSGSHSVCVFVTRNALFTEGLVIDEGEGIFHKIQRELGLYDPREAILELAKGKLTTDPENHSGEGIFFTSRVFDLYILDSGGFQFRHIEDKEEKPDLLQENSPNNLGTRILMRLLNHSPRIMQDIFDQFAAPEEYTFSKTIVPVKLAQYEGEKLVSRSQAKRLYQRFEKFRYVVLDFEGVNEIGQAFADELFRVFPARYPNVELNPTNTTEQVSRMISRARAGAEA